MTEATIAIIVNAIVTVAGVAGGVATAWMVLRTKQLEIEAKSVATNIKLDTVVEDMAEVKHNTNSLTAQLVELTDKEAFARGGAEEKAKAASTVDDAAKMQVEHIDVETMTVAKTEKKQP